MVNDGKNTKDDFIKYIDDQLKNFGFEKDSEKEIWACEKDVQSRGQTIIINGQRHDEPGQPHHIKYEVELYGDGEMKDDTTGKIDQFIEINFNVYQDEINVSEYPTFCMFFDDQMLFNSVLNKIFGL